MSTSKLFGKDILITSTTNASGTTIGSISTLGGMNVNQTMLVSGALTSTADSNTIGNLFTTGGNIGIGTTSPVQVLDVNGNLNITGNFFQNGSVYSGSTQWGSTGANIYFNAGNVGIGTLAPSTKLHLRDTGSVTVLIEADSDNVTETDVATLQFRQDGGTVGMDIGINSSNGSYINYNTGNTATADNFGILENNVPRLYINSNGNIGINTTSPHAKLTLGTTGNLSLTSDRFDTGKIMFGSVVSGAYNTNHRYYIQRGGTTGNMNHLIIHTPNEASNGGVNFMTTNQISRLFINSSSGNVGIGKTNPSSALDVVGNILSTGSIDAGTQFLGQALDSSTGPSFSWTGDTNTGIYRPLADTLGFVTNGTERIRVTTGGNVGIGTTSPTYTLDINENVNVFSSFNQNVLISPENGPRIYFGTKTNTSEYMVCGAYSSVNNIDTKNRPIQIFNSSGNTLFYGGTNGNVGIGSTSPIYTLDVNGTFRTNNINYLTSTTAIQATTNNYSLTSGALNVSGDIVLSGANEFMFTNTAAAPPTMNGRGSGTKIVLYPASSSGNGDYSIGIEDFNTWFQVPNINSGYKFYQGTSANFVIVTGGNVGIGTQAPLHKLHVNGNYSNYQNSTTGYLELSQGWQANAGYISFHQSNGTRKGYIGYGDNTDAFLLQGEGARNITIATNNVDRIIITSSGNVGIGTTTPAYNLDVNGSVFLSIMPGLATPGSLRFGRQDTPSIRYHDLEFATSTTQASTYMAVKLHNGSTTTSQTEVMRLRADGAVGIGTTAPQTTLHVSGNAGFQLGASNTAGVHMQANNSALNVWRGTWGTGIVAFCSDSRGNFGIGTHSPAYALDVTGSLRSTGDIFIGNGTTAEAINLWDIPGAAWQLSTGSYNLNIRNGTAGSTMVDRVTVTSTGNVGIGTTTPIGKISVDYNGISTNQNVLSLHTSNTGTTDYNLIEAGHGASTTFVLKGNGNVGIGTSTPAYPLDIINTVNSSNQPFMRIGNSAGGAGNQVGIILSPFSQRTGGASSQIISIDDGNASAHLTLWTAPSGTGTASVERVRIQNNGNVGIGTVSPSFTLDVNGTIARSGVKLPRYDNGSFSGSASFSIPILFNDTQYNYAEFRVRYVTSAICNMNISATSYVNAAMNFGECALTTVKWNAQGTPVYATFSGVTSGIFADTVEMVGIDNNLIFRIVRATGTSSTGLRNHYSYDNVYCWSGIGTARGYGQGHIDCASVGGSPLQFVTFTCSTGTISGTYSTVHYY